MANSILEDVRQTRERLQGDAGGTLAGLVAGLQRDERASTRTVLAVAELPGNRRLRECHEQYLLTWNFKHIANALHRDRIEGICRDAGVEPPIICTPEELLGADDGS